MGAFAKSATQYTTFEKRHDANGTVWIQAQAHDTLVALTPYKVIVNEYGYITAALADDTTRYYVGLPDAAASSGDIIWVQIGGYVAGMVTGSLSMAVGEAISVTNGALTDDAADYSGVANQFFVCTTATSNATAQYGILIPEMITGT